MDALNTKQCTACREHLPLEAYYRTKTGYNSYCKPCYIQYQSEYRRKKTSPKSRSQRPLFLINRERLVPGRDFRGRYTATHRPMVGRMCTHGYIIDGVLVYGEYDIEDILLYLHDKKIKVIESIVVDEPYEYTSVKNCCGNPIEVEVLIGLVSLDQYYLWMDDPRPMTPSEVSELCNIPLPAVNFILHEKKRGMVPTRPHSPGRKNSEASMPQVVDNTPVTKEDLDDIIFVEE